MTSPAPPDAARLDAAADLLTRVGRDAELCPPSVRIHCLRAADLLCVAGAEAAAHHAADPITDPGRTIRRALVELADLPSDLFATHAVVEAADTARIALERWETR